MTPAQAVFATSLYPLGGMMAVLYLGWAIDRLGARRSLAMHYAVGIVFISLISLVAMPYFALLAVVLMSGVTVLGSQTGLNAACGKLYPARMRTSGYGFATGIGRLGGIAAAPLGGYLLARIAADRCLLVSEPVRGDRRRGDRASGVTRQAAECRPGN
jgi:AAHS family 4-hydroxybenzoate transporter-like MFS transporter